MDYDTTLSIMMAIAIIFAATVITAVIRVARASNPPLFLEYQIAAAVCIMSSSLLLRRRHAADVAASQAVPVAARCTRILAPWCSRLRHPQPLPAVLAYSALGSVQRRKCGGWRSP